jgi:predicted cupin superfamily sugar epimerase
MLYRIDPQGQLSNVPMRRDIRAGQSVQAVLAGGTWFAAAIDDSSSYSLIGCTVSPGFDPLDFEFGNRDELLKKFPQHKSVIERFTR